MQPDLLIEFVSQQWMLVTALALCLFMLFQHESRKAGPALSPAQSISMINEEGGVFIDIRDAKEYGKGHIADAIHLPYASLTNRIGELEKYRDKPVIVVCRIGQTASAATKTLRAQGFEKAHRMTGGMMEWQAQKLPVVS